ncbi:MAG: maleylacetoacetate isomerase [Myxococcaceae bacterium]|jgi:maleylpyruvate isomerase|nr:maleylacetoacetate isomerase [Myxococcaceae bacterium]MCA3012976.1 maleylacetoacetate isomerase [Myxococcaceae bacterium]
MKLYNYWRSSSSYRVRLALHFKGVPFEYVAVSLLKGEQHEATHRDRNPAGYVPVLEVDDGGGVALLTQSVAIVEYLEECFPERPLFPSSRVDRARVRGLVELVNSGIQPFHNLATLNHLKAIGADEKAWAKHFVTQGLASLEALAQRHAGRFLFGDAFTFADCCLIPQLYGARRFGADVSAFPLLTRVEQACLELPHVQAARPEAQPDAQPV